MGACVEEEIGRNIKECKIVQINSRRKKLIVKRYENIADWWPLSVFEQKWRGY